MTIPARERLRQVVLDALRDEVDSGKISDKLIAAFPEIGEDYKFKVGDYVRKPKGYYYEGWVIGHCHTRAGELRYLVESPWRQVYIFNEEQLEAYTPETETVESLKSQLEDARIKNDGLCLDNAQWSREFGNLTKERESLKAQLDKVRDALLIFANASQTYVGDRWRRCSTIDELELLTVSDLRRAAAAMEGKPEPHE